MSAEELKKKFIEFKDDVNSYLLKQIENSTDLEFLPLLEELIGCVPCSLINFAHELKMFAVGTSPDDDWERVRFKFQYKDIDFAMIVTKTQKENTNESELQPA
jgi:hypothetical protein